MLTSAALTLVAVSVVGCGDNPRAQDQLPAGAAAKVGGALIRESAVRTRMEAAYAVQGGSIETMGPPNYPACVAAKRGQARPGETTRDIRRQCKFEFGITQAQAVDGLVHEQWLAREARRRGITTANEVRTALARDDRLLRMAIRRGVPRDQLPTLDRRELASQARVGALYKKLVATVPISEGEITAYAGANASVFLDSEIRTAEILQTTSRRKAVAALGQLRHRTTWRAVQDRYGIRPFSQHWTGRRTVKKSTAPSDSFGRALFTSRRGHVAGPIHTLNGWFLFELLKVKPPRRTHITAEAHDTVANTMRSKQLDRVLHDRYAGQTVCRSRYQIPEAPHCRQTQ